MAEVVVKTVFKLKRGLAEAWARNNPLLQAGEPGYELDTRKLKIGNGTSKWNDLPYFSELELSEEQIAAAVQKYLEEHPLQVSTDTSFTQVGVAADAAAIGEKCIYVGDTSEIIFRGGDADLID